MSTTNTKGSSDQAAAILEALQVVRDLQISIKKSDDRLQKVEEVTHNFSETQQKLEAKMDDITIMLQQWNSSSEFISAEKAPHSKGSPSPLPPSFSAPDYTQLHNTTFFTSTPHTTSTSSSQSFAFTPLEPEQKPTSSVVYTIQPNNTPTNTSASLIPNQQTPKTTTFTPENQRTPPETFSLAIARPKLDFPSYSGDDPYN
jgi:hypothetical protein